MIIPIVQLESFIHAQVGCLNDTHHDILRVSAKVQEEHSKRDSRPSSHHYIFRLVDLGVELQQTVAVASGKERLHAHAEGPEGARRDAAETDEEEKGGADEKGKNADGEVPEEGDGVGDRFDS